MIDKACFKNGTTSWRQSWGNFVFEGDAVAAVGFALVHALVGAVEAFFGGFFGAGEYAADGDGDGDGFALVLEAAFFDEAAAAFGDAGEHVFGDVGQDDDEFFAAPTSHEVEGAQAVVEGLGDHAEHVVADGVAVGVVDVFEVVDVDKQHAEAPVVAAEFFEGVVEGHEGVAAVADAGEGAEQGHFFEFFDVLFFLYVGAVFAEDFECADDVAAGVAYGADATQGGDVAVVVVLQENFEVAGLGVFQGEEYGGFAFEEGSAFVVEMTEEVVGTGLADNVGFAVAGDAFSAVIPIGDAPVHVDEEDAVGQVI